MPADPSWMTPTLSSVIGLLIILLVVYLVRDCMIIHEGAHAETRVEVEVPRVLSVSTLERRLLTPIMEGHEEGSTMPRISFSFDGLSSCLGGRLVLRDISGFLKSGDGILAVIGPVGSGKSTLLRLISGYCVESERMEGRIRINSADLPPAALRNYIGYVDFSNKSFPTQTVRESLQFTARLHFPHWLSSYELDGRVTETMSKLKLQDVSEVPISQLSAPNLRLLSLANAIVFDPPVVVIDEPVGDLDVGTANQIMSAISELIGYGQIIICAFQHPRSIVLSRCSNVLLLGSDGGCVYYGEKSKVETYFQSMQLRKPADLSLGEFMLDIVTDANPSILADYQYRFSQSREYRMLKAELQMPMVGDPPKHDPRLSYSGQMYLLIRRLTSDVKRNRLLLLSHCALMAVAGLMIGIAFAGQRRDYNGFYSLTGMLFFSCIIATSLGLTGLRFIAFKKTCYFELHEGLYHLKVLLFSWALVDTLLLRMLPIVIYSLFVALFVSLHESIAVFIARWIEMSLILTPLAMLMSSISFLFTIFFQSHFVISFFCMATLLISLFLSNYIFPSTIPVVSALSWLSPIEGCFATLVYLFFLKESDFLFNPHGIGLSVKLSGKQWLQLYSFDRLAPLARLDVVLLTNLLVCMAIFFALRRAVYRS